MNFSNDSINIDSIVIRSFVNDELLNEDKKDFINRSEERKILKKYDFFCINEINISNIIKNIKYYNTKYHILNKINHVKFGEITKNKFIIRENKQKITEDFVLLTYPYEYFECPVTYWEGLDYKDFLYHLLDSYNYLLLSLNELNENGICFFDVSLKNIQFDNKFKPILKNFEHSLIISNIDEKNIENFILKNDEFTTKPLEVHLLYYLIKNEMNTLSLTIIDAICAYYVGNLQFIHLFSPRYREKYQEECINSLKKYINVPKKEIISMILREINTWDNFNLSVIYFYLFGNFLRVFSLRDTFINKICDLLMECLHPEPSKRKSLKNVILDFTHICNGITDIDVINYDEEKIIKLYKILFSQ